MHTGFSLSRCYLSGSQPSSHTGGYHGPIAHVAAGPGSGRYEGLRLIWQFPHSADPPHPRQDCTAHLGWGFPFRVWYFPHFSAQCALLTGKKSDSYLIGSHRADHTAQFLVVLGLQVDGLALVVPAENRTQTKKSGRTG